MIRFSLAILFCLTTLNVQADDGLCDFTDRIGQSLMMTYDTADRGVLRSRELSEMYKLFERDLRAKLPLFQDENDRDLVRSAYFYFFHYKVLPELGTLDGSLRFMRFSLTPYGDHWVKAREADVKKFLDTLYCSQQ